MSLDIVLRLETKIDQLLARNRELDEERGRLLEENRQLKEEKERFRSELDKVLAKLDFLDQEVS